MFTFRGFDFLCFGFRFICCFFLFCGCVSVLTGCGASSGGESGQENAGKLRIVATTGMLGDAVRRIVGNHVLVEVLMGPGIDPHLYKPTPSDLSALRRADAIFYNGLHLEAKMAEVLKNMSARHTVFAAGDALQKKDLNYPAGAALPDPHIWFDLSLWQKVVLQIGKAMAALDTANADFYLKNMSAYYQELESLDAFAAAEIARIPASQRILLTAHDAFGYFGAAYGIEVKGLQGISTTAEFGLKDLSAMVKMIKMRRIKAIFLETAISDRAIKAVVAGCQKQGHDVKIGGTLYADALGEAGTPEASFTGVIRHNLRTIVEALGTP